MDVNKPVDPAEARVCELIGEAEIRRLVAGFYRQIPTDEILGPMYPPHDLAAAEQRLADFLLFRFGGPDKYVQERGHPRLRMRHAPFDINPAARDRWVKLMENALTEVNWSEPVHSSVQTFLFDTATFLINRL